MLSLSHIYKTFFFIALFLCGYTSVFAQGYTINYKDSLSPADGFAVVYNNLEITNTGSEALTLKGKAAFPKGWQGLFGKDISVQVAPKSTVVIPINIMSSRSASAVWAPVVFRFWTNDSLNAKTYSYYVKATPRPSFIAQTLDGDDLFFETNPHNIKLGVYLKNTGNLPDNYTLHFYNRFFNLDRHYTINVGAGRDTVIHAPIAISNGLWRAFRKETVGVTLSSAAKDEKNLRASIANSLTLTFELSRSRSAYKENKSAFAGLPLTVQGGMFAYGKQLNYFGGLLTNFQVGHHSVMFNYRSRQLSNVATNFIQRDFFLLDYSYKKYFLRASTMGISQNFYIVGKSLGVGYSDGGNLFSLTGTKSDKNSILQQGDNLNAVARYGIAKDIYLSHTAEMNLDKSTNLNSYIVDNKIELLNNHEIQVSAHVGASSENKTLAVPANVDKNVLGYSGGYSFQMRKKHYSINSRIDHYSPEFAGLRKGMSFQSHNVNWLINKNNSVGLMYQLNIIKRNIFRDSLYNSDIFTFNSSRYGVTYNTLLKKSTFGFASGIMEQKGDMYMSMFNKYFFGELTSTHTFNSDLRAQAYLFLGGNELGFITNSNITVDHKFGGVTALYTKNLMHNGEGDVIPVETIYGGPYINVNTFARKLTGNIRLNFAKSIHDNTLRSGLNANLAYSNEGSGTHVNVNGFYPFKTISNGERLPFIEQKHGAINISQDLHIPLRRKFYDIKVVMFNDENNNNIKDPGEEYLQDVPLDINNMTLFTDVNGAAQYRNIQSGNYSVGVYKAYSEEGIIPTNGPTQTVQVNGNNSVLSMPFKKGRVISGNVRIIQDALNSTAISSQFIKITATDSLNHKYTTLTDQEGNFFLYVPEGVFTVALNPSAFTGSAKPVRPSFDVDILNNENAFVAFEIRQKKREVRFLNQTTAQAEEPKQPAKPVVKLTQPEAPKQSEQPVAAPEAPINHAAKRHQ